MRKAFVLLFHCFLVVMPIAEGQAISGEVRYKFHLDSTVLINVLNAMKEKNPTYYPDLAHSIKSGLALAQLMDFRLNFTMNTARFWWRKDAALLDSEYAEGEMLAKTTTGYTGPQIVDRGSQTRYTESTLSGGADAYRVEREFELYDWELKDEFVTIGNYRCQKAVGTYGQVIVIAYFTTELPFPYGPIGVDGLPGLIIKLCTAPPCKAYYLAEQIQISQDPEEFAPTMAKVRNTVSETEFYRLMGIDTKQE